MGYVVGQGSSVYVMFPLLLPIRIMGWPFDGLRFCVTIFVMSVVDVIIG
jgi:hypothetical protein